MKMYSAKEARAESLKSIRSAGDHIPSHTKSAVMSSIMAATFAGHFSVELRERDSTSTVSAWLVSLGYKVTLRSSQDYLGLHYTKLVVSWEPPTVDLPESKL